MCWDLSVCGYALLDGRHGKWGGWGNSRQESKPLGATDANILDGYLHLFCKILGQGERKLQLSVPHSPSLHPHCPFSRPSLKASTDL